MPTRRNVHDGVAQDLTAIKAYLQQGDREKSAYYADRALSEVRYLIDSSRIAPEEGVEHSIREMLTVFAANYDIKTTFVATSALLGKLGASYQAELIRIMQEALSNIARHAQATEVQVKLTDVGDDLHIVIRDNGVGFSGAAPDATSAPHDGTRRHWGLTNIQERAKAMHGTARFIQDGGTVIAVPPYHPVS